MKNEDVMQSQKDDLSSREVSRPGGGGGGGGPHVSR